MEGNFTFVSRARYINKEPGSRIRGRAQLLVVISSHLIPLSIWGSLIKILILEVRDTLRSQNNVKSACGHQIHHLINPS